MKNQKNSKAEQSLPQTDPLFTKPLPTMEDGKKRLLMCVNPFPIKDRPLPLHFRGDPSGERVSADKVGITIVRDHPEAVLPSKAHDSDSGIDVTIIDVYKKLAGGVTLFQTGLRLAPDPGYYTDLVARSSLMKYGYMLANGVGIIDNSYRGPLLVALLKFDPTSPDLTLPMRVAQLVPRKIVDVEVVEMTSLDQTDRGDGGFGSTGK